VDGESWFAEGQAAAVRARRHGQYDHYLRHEVLPFTQKCNTHPFLIVAGTSFGSYHALNFAFRYPEHVGRVISMSGLWDIRWLTGGYADDTIYYHNPVDFLAYEHQPQRLEALRRMDIILAVGGDEYVRPNLERLSRILWSKGIW